MSEILVINSYSGRSFIKKYLIKNKTIPYQCALCANTGKWLENDLSLHLDHINGVRNDNRVNNLRFLCPNCHSQQETSHRKKGQNYNKFPKISVEKVIEARDCSNNIRQMLLYLGVADASANYAKVKKILARLGKSFPVLLKIKGGIGGGYAKGVPNFSIRKVERPSKEKLIHLLSHKPITQIALIYGLKSDTSILKWRKSYGIDHTKISPFSHKFKKNARVAKLGFEPSNCNLAVNVGEIPITSTTSS